MCGVGFAGTSGQHLRAGCQAACALCPGPQELRAGCSTQCSHPVHLPRTCFKAVLLPFCCALLLLEAFCSLLLLTLSSIRITEQDKHSVSSTWKRALLFRAVTGYQYVMAGVLHLSHSLAQEAPLLGEKHSSASPLTAP